MSRERRTAESRGLRKLPRFSYFHAKTYAAAKIELIENYLSSLFILLSVVNIHFAQENISGLDFGRCPRPFQGCSLYVTYVPCCLYK